MPLYEYECKPNAHRFEVRHGMNEDPVSVCPECGGPVRRVINAVGIVFKGSGFYATDSKKASRAMSDAKPASDGGTPSAHSEGGEKSEAKSGGEESSGSSSKSEGEKKKSESSGDTKAAS
ncbi:MAG: hypothetical protein PVSMB7_25080 [Chloroflexota bacterium]